MVVQILTGALLGFAFSGPALWNSLPSAVHDNSLSTTLATIDVPWLKNNRKIG